MTGYVRRQDIEELYEELYRRFEAIKATADLDTDTPTADSIFKGFEKGLGTSLRELRKLKTYSTFTTVK